MSQDNANTTPDGTGPVDRPVGRLVDEQGEMSMLKLKHLDGALRQEQMQERSAWKAANELGSAPISPWERGRIDALAGKAAPDLVRPDGAWSARLYAAGWDRGAEQRKTPNKG